MALAGSLGTTMASISLATSLMFIVSLARFSSFPDWRAILEQCVLYCAGGLWPMLGNER
ncbi:MAG: hypothetical protein WA984_05490 [Phormidesmis sp.]